MKVKWIVIFMFCILLSGCGKMAPEQMPEAGITFTDARGETITVNHPERVGICSGSLAECWLLAGGEAAAVTSDAVTERNLELSADCIELGSLKEPSMETILASDVDFLILMANLSNHVEMADTLEKVGIPHAYFDVENFEDYLELMKIFTEITGRADLYEKNAASIQPVIEAAIADGKREDGPSILILRASSSRVKVLNSEDMVGGMLHEFGCVNIADAGGGLLDEMSIEAMVEADPDYIFVTCMGDPDEAKAQMDASLTSNPIWATLQAVKNDRVFYLEKELFHYKPNARWGESYEVLAELLAQ